MTTTTTTVLDYAPQMVRPVYRDGVGWWRFCADPQQRTFATKEEAALAASVETAQESPAMSDAPARCLALTVQALAHQAGSKAEVAKACQVSERTVGYWRSGQTARVPFAAVLVLANLCGCPIDRVRP